MNKKPLHSLRTNRYSLGFVAFGLALALMTSACGDEALPVEIQSSSSASESGDSDSGQAASASPTATEEEDLKPIPPIYEFDEDDEQEEEATSTPVPDPTPSATPEKDTEGDEDLKAVPPIYDLDDEDSADAQPDEDLKAVPPIHDLDDEDSADAQPDEDLKAVPPIHDFDDDDSTDAGPHAQGAPIDFACELTPTGQVSVGTTVTATGVLGAQYPDSPIDVTINFGDGTSEVRSTTRSASGRQEVQIQHQFNHVGAYIVEGSSTVAGQFFQFGCGFIQTGDGGAPADRDFTASDYVGLSQADAEQLAVSRGLTSRITSVDGQPFAVSADYDFLRVNFDIENGVVVRAIDG